MPYEFLSPDWISAVRSLRDELDVETETPPVLISLNVTVTDAPAGSATTAHVDTTSGVPLMDEGHLDAVELSVTIDYATARALFIEANPAALMSAIMEGKIRIDGDASKLMALQGASASARALVVAATIRAFTA
jgi:hypothetical protein